MAARLWQFLPGRSGLPKVLNAGLQHVSDVDQQVLAQACGIALFVPPHVGSGLLRIADGLDRELELGSPATCGQMWARAGHSLFGFAWCSGPALCGERLACCFGPRLQQECVGDTGSGSSGRCMQEPQQHPAWRNS